jgi:hypothetical protein
MTPEDFAVKFNTETAVPALVWNSNEALAVRLGWKIIKTEQAYHPLVLSKDIVSRTYGPLAAGKVSGYKAIVITHAETASKEVVQIETHEIGQVYYDDLEDYCHW